MTPPDPADVLRTCRLFARLDDAQRQRLEAMAAARSYVKGHAIFREGDPCPGLFVVAEGMVRIYKLSPAGKQHVLHLASPGQTFAEAAVIGGFACPAFAEALEPTRVVLLPQGPFMAALRTDHSLCLNLLAGMAGWVKHFVNLTEDLVLRDAAGRVARYLLQAADGDEQIQLPTLKRHLASHLNLTSETLSRTLRRLLDAGMLEEGPHGQLSITDAAALRSAADGLYP